MRIQTSSFLSSISVLTMRFLQDSSRSLCFWSLHQSWSSRCFLFQIFPDIVHPGLPLSPSASLSLYVSNVPCAHAHFFSTMKQALLTPTTGFSLVYDLGSPVVSTPAGRGSTSSFEGDPVDVVAHIFKIQIHHHVRVSWSLPRW